MNVVLAIIYNSISSICVIIHSSLYIVHCSNPTAESLAVLRCWPLVGRNQTPMRPTETSILLA